MKKVVLKTLLSETLCNSFGRKEIWIWFSYAATCLPELCLTAQDCASLHLCFWIASLQWIRIPQDLWYFFQWLRCLILIVNVLYCKTNHDSVSLSIHLRSVRKMHQLILPCFCWATCYYVLPYLMDIAAAQVWAIRTLGYPSFMN